MHLSSMILEASLLESFLAIPLVFLVDRVWALVWEICLKIYESPSESSVLTGRWTAETGSVFINLVSWSNRTPTIRLSCFRNHQEEGCMFKKPERRRRQLQYRAKVPSCLTRILHQRWYKYDLHRRWWQSCNYTLEGGDTLLLIREVVFVMWQGAYPSSYLRYSMCWSLQYL